MTVRLIYYLRSLVQFRVSNEQSRIFTRLSTKITCVWSSFYNSTSGTARETKRHSLQKLLPPQWSKVLKLKVYDRNFRFSHLFKEIQLSNMNTNLSWKTALAAKESLHKTFLHMTFLLKTKKAWKVSHQRTSIQILFTSFRDRLKHTECKILARKLKLANLTDRPSWAQLKSGLHLYLLLH